jgi:hypothetical protein
MSRTDKTQPYWTRLRDRGGATDIHDHANGDCDLPSLKEWITLLTHEPENLATNRCYWQVSKMSTYKSPPCGCELCTQQVGRKLKTRRDRHRRAKEARSLAKRLSRNPELDEE